MQGIMSVLFQFLSQDISRLLLLGGGGALLGLIAGRGRMLVLLLTTYCALALATNAPWIAFLQSSFSFLRSPFSGIGWFGFLYVIILFLFWRSHVLGGVSEERGAWWEAMIFGCLQLGCLMSCVLFLLPAGTAMQSGAPALEEWFGSVGARSFWLTMPFLFIGICLGVDRFSQMKEERILGDE